MYVKLKMKEYEILLFYFAGIRLENPQSKIYVLMGSSTEEILEA